MQLVPLAKHPPGLDYSVNFQDRCTSTHEGSKTTLYCLSLEQIYIVEKYVREKYNRIVYIQNIER